jgi:toxin CcdB
MARFDLYRLARGRGDYVVDVQSSHLDTLDSRVVVPLHARTDAKPVTELHPAVVIGEARYLLVTHALASVQRRQLGHPIGNLAAYRDSIMRALDVLLVGF